MVPRPPASLIRHLREKRCVLFCGSGLSAWAKLPTWAVLLERMVQQLADEVPDDPHLDELRRLLKLGKLLEVADHCKEALGRRYNDILSEQLRGGTGEIPAPHQVIARLPFAAVVTTNYDKLLERTYSSFGSLPRAPTPRDVDALGPLLFDGAFFILKAHGDIDLPESMVLTTREYQQLIHANPAFDAIFSAILLTKAVLFVGYSLNDPDFRLLLDRQLTVFRGNVPERYALMCGVGEVERDVLWRTSRIRVLAYDEEQHDQVLAFLQDLAREMGGDATAPDAAAPVSAAARAAAVSPGPDAASAVTVLRIRTSGTLLEAELSSPVGTPIQGVGARLDWPSLAATGAKDDEANALRVGVRLAALLPAAVLKGLERLPAERLLRLDLTPELEVLPWEWLMVKGQLLRLRHPLARGSIGVSDAARGYPKVRQPPKVLLIGDPSSEDRRLPPLPGARSEVQAIAQAYAQERTVACTSLVGGDAGFDRVASELLSGDHDIVHFAGHAWFGVTEPYLYLAGGVRLHSSELRSLLSVRPPAILFLNSHYTIFTPPGAWVDEKFDLDADERKPKLHGQRGFIEAATTAGVGALIGNFSGALDDGVANAVGVDFHRMLLRGLPVARALHEAVLASTRSGQSGQGRLSYVVSGYADTVLPPAPAGDP